MDNKQIRKKRMMDIFINAAHEIMEQEGVEAVTIRKVANEAGYNSSTLYNYFENLDHLIFFASMKYVEDYLVELPYYIKNSNNSLEKLINVWECFCYKSFNLPHVYNSIFLGKFAESMDTSIKDYYSIYPSDLGKFPIELRPMLLSGNLYYRNKILLNACVNEGFISSKHIDEMNEMLLLVYKGMIDKALASKTGYYPVDIANKTIHYIKRTIKSFLLKESDIINY